MQPQLAQSFAFEQNPVVVQPGQELVLAGGEQGVCRVWIPARLDGLRHPDQVVDIHPYM